MRHRSLPGARLCVMTTETLQRALDALHAAEQRTRARVPGSVAHAVARIEEERASKAVWDAAAGEPDDEPSSGPVAPAGR